jgi:sugar lactone lactonase YvrE
MRWQLDAQGWPRGEPEPWAEFSGQTVNPDGATVDAEGCVWLSLWGAGRVVRLDHRGRHIDEVRLPVSRPTCPVFGGRDLERLYITTARGGLSAADLEEEPQAGGLFEATVGVAGLAEPPLSLA